MASDIDREIGAIGTVLKALEPLDQKSRQSVLDYVIRRLEITVSTSQSTELSPEASALPPGEPLAAAPETSRRLHIKDLVQEKKPRSAIEMATLVAYYLSHKAPQNDRKQTITTKDIETYFKIANFKLPSKLKFTLPNTKGAGYIDAVGVGEYKLNPVGYNLVVHSMPKSTEEGSRKIWRKKPSKRKESKKKANVGQ